jgi:hypothetical protein
VKNKDFEAIATGLLSVLPGFSIRGPMAFAQPARHVLRGLYFEGSGFDSKAFYVWMFFLPLCVPVAHVYFNFGKRLRAPGGGDGWAADTPDLSSALKAAVTKEAVPFLSRVGSMEGVVTELEALRSTGGPHAQQGLAYTLAQAGDVKRGMVELRRLIESLDRSVSWQRAIGERADVLLHALEADSAGARRQLELWEAETVRNLKLGSIEEGKRGRERMALG